MRIETGRIAEGSSRTRWMIKVFDWLGFPLIEEETVGMDGGGTEDMTMILDGCLDLGSEVIFDRARDPLDFELDRLDSIDGIGQFILEDREMFGM